MNSQWKDGWFEDICAEAEGFQGESVVVADGKLIEALLDHAPVNLSKSDVFTGSLEHIDGLRQVKKKRIEESEVKLKKDSSISKLLLAHQLRTYKGDYDFSHTAPDWQAIMSLGLPGLLSRLQTAVSKATEQSQKDYYDAGIRVYQAAIRYFPADSMHTSMQE